MDGTHRLAPAGPAAGREGDSTPTTPEAADEEHAWADDAGAGRPMGREGSSPCLRLSLNAAPAGGEEPPAPGLELLRTPPAASGHVRPAAPATASSQVPVSMQGKTRSPFPLVLPGEATAPTATGAPAAPPPAAASAAQGIVAVVASQRHDPNIDSRKPIFHVMPKSGWGSDPNGPIFYKGRYHL